MPRRALLLVVSSLASACGTAQGGSTSIPRDALVEPDVATEDAPARADALFPTEDAAPLGDGAPDAVDAASCGVPGAACCEGSVCGAGYCHEGTCYELPRLVEEGSAPDGCADLGKTHTAPQFLARWTAYGRPGATVYKFAKQVSCAGATATMTSDSPVTLGPDGKVSRTIESTASSDCTSANLGRWESWIVVDGRESAHQHLTVFNSKCLKVFTCAAAAKFCPN